MPLLRIETNVDAPDETALLMERLTIPPERVFINFHDMPRPDRGWNRTTF